MEKYLREIFDMEKKEQKENLSLICPRCGNFQMRPVLAQNSRSRYVDVSICSACGIDEAGRDYMKKTMHLLGWHIVRKALEGRTFMDYLRGQKDFECELIIDNSDIPATFTWSEDCTLTVYGLEHYAEILQAPYEKLPNGNIEIFCDNYELGKHFVLAYAGYIGCAEYRMLFSERAFAEHELSFDRPEPDYTDDGLDFILTVNDDDPLDRYGLPPEANVEFHAVYHPEQNVLKCCLTVYEPGNGMEAKQQAYYHTPAEAELILAVLREYAEESGYNSLSELWERLQTYAAPEDGAADIVMTDAPQIVDGAVNMLVELWPGFDHDRLKEPLPEGEDVSVFYIASCIPDSKLVKYMCVAIDEDGEETVQEYVLTEQEKAALWQAMSIRCQEAEKCSLVEFIQSEGL